MILKIEFPISYLHEERTIHIYLPDTYLQDKKQYPVLYMFDGHNLFNDEDATYGRAWRLNEELKKSKKECIVIGIECSHHGNQRLVEYSPYPFFDPELGDMPGWGQQTMDFIVHELKPYVDSHFPTIGDRDHTWIGGSSCGGLMALYAGIKYSFTFSKALVISPYIQPTYTQIQNDLHNTFIHPHTSFYISWGAKEEDNPQFFIEETHCCIEICNDLINKNVYVQMNARMNGSHCEKSWQEEAQDYLSFVFE